MHQDELSDVAVGGANSFERAVVFDAVNRSRVEGEPDDDKARNERENDECPELKRNAT